MGVRIAGTGSYLPGPPIDHEGVRHFLRRYPDGLSETFQERLLQETGILTRHFAIDPGTEARQESNTSMAAQAGRRALDAAGWKPDDVELLVVTTVIPDQLMPPTSTLVQEALEIRRCCEFEISANCTAPYKGLSVAVGQLLVGRFRRALVCSSQYVSFLGFPPWAHPERMGIDEGQLRWIVSDGASAIALETGEPDTEFRVWLESSGSGKPAGMSLPFGAGQPDFLGTWERGGQHVSQNIRYVIREGLSLAVESLPRMLAEFDVRPECIDHFIPAVSSIQVERKLRRRFAECPGIRDGSWRTNYTRVGYLGGVNFLILLDEMARADQLRPGQLICSVAEESSKWMAAGALLRWNP